MSNPDAEQELLEVGADALRERGLGGLAERLRYQSDSGMPPGWVTVSVETVDAPWWQNELTFHASHVVAISESGISPIIYVAGVGRLELKSVGSLERVQRAIWEAFGRGG